MSFLRPSFITSHHNQHAVKSHKDVFGKNGMLSAFLLFSRGQMDQNVIMEIIKQEVHSN